MQANPLPPAERQLEAVREITVGMVQGASGEELFELVASHAMELVEADVATIALATDEGELVLRAVCGHRADELRSARFPRDSSISGEVIQQRRPFEVEDVGADGRAFQPNVKAGGFGPALFVPLTFEGETFGTLLVARERGGDRFGHVGLDLLETFANQASLAFVHERVRRTLQEAGVLAERDRLAEDLRDAVIHELFGIGLELERIAGHLDGGCEHHSRTAEADRRSNRSGDPRDSAAASPRFGFVASSVLDRDGSVQSRDRLAGGLFTATMSGQ